jgi:hypothetical protein
VGIPEFGAPGPAQSDELIHFVHRGPRARFSPDVPVEIRIMTPEKRLDAILTRGAQRGFAPFHRPPTKTTQPPLGRCVCYSEAPPEHLAHLITERLFHPWGVVITREQMLRAGGGAIAYVPDAVYDRFYEAGLGAWAVRVGDDSQWMHEREWRFPLTKGYGAVRFRSLAAILIGDTNWRPSKVGTGEWINESGERIAGPSEDPMAREVTAFPELWLKTPIWVWSYRTRKVDIHPPGSLI